jgi:hypothetical protein
MYIPSLRVIHCLACLTTGPHSLPKWVFHTVRSSASSFSFQYPLFTFGHPVAAYVFFLAFPSHVPSMTCFRMVFLRQMWPIQLAFILFAVHKIFLAKHCSLCTFVTPSFLANKRICSTRHRIDSPPYFHTKPEVITCTKGNNNVAVLYNVNLLNSVSRRLYKHNLLHIVAVCIVHCCLQRLTTRRLTNLPDPDRLFTSQ